MLAAAGVASYAQRVPYEQETEAAATTPCWLQPGKPYMRSRPLTRTRATQQLLLHAGCSRGSALCAAGPLRAGGKTAASVYAMLAAAGVASYAQQAAYEQESEVAGSTYSVLLVAAWVASYAQQASNEQPSAAAASTQWWLQPG